LLFCQTVSEAIAEELAAQATELNPGIKFWQFRMSARYDN
jgi:hypothetical protein